MRALGRQERGADQQDGAASCPGDKQPARPAVFGPIAARGQQPQHGQHREQHPRGDRERRSARAARLGDEGAHRDQHQNLQQERAAGAGVVVAMQLVVQAAVEPGDPHQREHHHELAEAAPRQVPGQVVGGLGDQHDRGQVIEKLERADRARLRLLAMRARRPPQQAAQPGPPRPASGCAGATLGRRRHPGRSRCLAAPA
jgi:hypothetical protein